MELEASIGDLTIAYELIGDGDGRPWIITPGGRFTKDDPGIREMAQALAERGDRAVIWDRPNCGASSVCFEGHSESEMQADALAGLIEHLELGPTVIAGGSGGARVSLLAAVRHRELAAGLALWWISGRALGLMSLAMHYCSESLKAAWNDGMEAVIALPEWAEVLERDPKNRERFLAHDPREFVSTMERWMAAYSPVGDDLVPGLGIDEAQSFDLPTLVFRSGESDFHHPRSTSEHVAATLPNAHLVEPPWGDREWMERQQARTNGTAPGLFVRWPLLVPQLAAWADEALDR